MGIMDILKKKKPEPETDFSQTEFEPRKDFPEEFEQFKLPPPSIEEKPSPFDRAEKNISERKEEPFIPEDILSKTTNEAKHEKNSDKIDLILSKLETIDTRLKLIEEKLHH